MSPRMDDAVTVERERRSALDPRDGDKYSRENHFRFNSINLTDIFFLNQTAAACTPAEAILACMISGIFAMTHSAAASAQNPAIRSVHQRRKSARWNEKCLLVSLTRTSHEAFKIQPTSAKTHARSRARCSRVRRHSASLGARARRDRGVAHPFFLFILRLPRFRRVASG